MGTPPAAAPAGPRSRAWLGILLFGAVAVGLYYAPFFGPELAGGRVHRDRGNCRRRRVRQPPPQSTGEPLGGRSRRRMLSTTLGDVVWYWLSLVQNVSPTTSLADVFYLGEYPCSSPRNPPDSRPPDRAVVLDTLIITTGVSVVVLEFVVRPYVESFTGSRWTWPVLSPIRSPT